MYMDNISVSAIPMPDINIVAYNAIEIASDTSFSFHPYWIRLSADSVDSMILIDSTRFYIHGLTPLTSYCVTIYEDSITPSCHEAFCFTTSHLQSLPYCEEFADYGTGSGAFPTGWQRHIGYTSNTTTMHRTTETYVSKHTTGCMSTPCYPKWMSTASATSRSAPRCGVHMTLPLCSSRWA